MVIKVKLASDRKEKGTITPYQGPPNFCGSIIRLVLEKGEGRKNCSYFFVQMFARYGDRTHDHHFRSQGINSLAIRSWKSKHNFSTGVKTPG